MEIQRDEFFLPKYLKLNSVAFIYQGSAGNTKSYLETMIIPIIDDMDKILFIFDYDAGQGGDQCGQKGYQEVTNIKSQYASGKFEYFCNPFPYQFPKNHHHQMAINA